MTDIPAYPDKSWDALLRETLSLSEGNFLQPSNLFTLAFEFAATLCLAYAILLPILYYIATDRMLFSDASIYYLLSAIGLFFTGKAIPKG